VFRSVSALAIFHGLPEWHLLKRSSKLRCQSTVSQVGTASNARQKATFTGLTVVFHLFIYLLFIEQRLFVRVFARPAPSFCGASVYNTVLFI
jgi:hypothetical protein